MTNGVNNRLNAHVMGPLWSDQGRRVKTDAVLRETGAFNVNERERHMECNEWRGRRRKTKVVR